MKSRLVLAIGLTAIVGLSLTSVAYAEGKGGGKPAATKKAGKGKTHAEKGKQSSFTLREVMQHLSASQQQIQTGLLMNNRLMIKVGAAAIQDHPMPKGGIKPYIKKNHAALKSTIKHGARQEGGHCVDGGAAGAQPHDGHGLHQLPQRLPRLTSAHRRPRASSRAAGQRGGHVATKRLPTEQRRAQLAEVALRLLAERGPGGLTLVELGDAVGIADASVLRHFKDKGDIIDAAIELFGRLLAEDLPGDIDDPMRRLGAFFVRRFAKVRERPELMALAYNARLHDAADDDGAALVDAHIARSAQFVHTCVQDAQQRGQVSADVPAQMWVWVLAGLLRGAAQALPVALAGKKELATMSPERTWELVERMMRNA